jgi:hypothetical protein
MPRLVFVVPDEHRQRQLLGWLTRQHDKGRWRFLPTVLVGIRTSVTANLLALSWRKPGSARAVKLFDLI